jgi:hypothetical protein
MKFSHLNTQDIARLGSHLALSEPAEGPGE